VGVGDGAVGSKGCWCWGVKLGISVEGVCFVRGERFKRVEATWRILPVCVGDEWMVSEFGLDVICGWIGGRHTMLAPFGSMFTSFTVLNSTKRSFMTD
jgi:hypothetical protein